MKPDIEKIISILYYPVNYTDSSHFPEEILENGIWDETLINYWLLTQYKLEDMPIKKMPCDPISSLVLTHWQKIPIIAHLIGGYLLRGQLLSQGASLLIDHRLLTFISLPLVHHVAMKSVTQHIDTYRWGVVFILSQLTNFPIALRQRFLLSFPAQMALPNNPISSHPDHINLLRMAITYANDYQK
ncbi:type III secretion system protein [Pectobacterium brasiliense]|uniref:type III secretion system protein n=1 Tax=Pectobacterium brasiliense TaxID=180957 RepID=UPI0019697E30|nr:type III secretion system protein [Pectobacterium brasiliense]MBN3264696.1 type III secretion system protein [Pectobacterium brasiliense]